MLLAEDTRPLDPQYVGLYRPDLLLVTLRRPLEQDPGTYFGTPQFDPLAPMGYPMPPPADGPAPAAPPMPAPPPAAAVGKPPVHLAAFQPAPPPAPAEAPPVHLLDHPRVARAQVENGQLVLDEYDWRPVMEQKQEQGDFYFTPHWLPRPARTKLNPAEVRLVDRRGVAGDATPLISQLNGPTMVLVFGHGHSPPPLEFTEPVVNPAMLNLFQPGVPCITAPNETANRVMPKPSRPALPEPMLGRADGDLLILTRLLPEMRKKVESYTVSKMEHRTKVEIVEETLPDGIKVQKQVEVAVEEPVYETQTRGIRYSFNRPQGQAFLRSEVTVESAAGAVLPPVDVEAQLTFDTPVLVATVDDPALENSRRLLKPDALVVVLPKGRALSEPFLAPSVGFDAAPPAPPPAPRVPPSGPDLPLAEWVFSLGGSVLAIPHTSVPPTFAQYESMLRARRVGGLPEGEFKVVGVEIRNKPLDAAGLQLLGNAASLRWLRLVKGSLSDDQLAFLRNLPSLEFLCLAESKISDTGLTHLAGLKNLRRLELSAVDVKGPGLVHLSGNSKLETLHLFQTPVTDTHLIHLEGFKELSELTLQRSRVTDTGLVHLQGLKKLQTLILRDTGVSDAGFVHLAGLTELRRLHVGNTRVVGKELERLKPLGKLEEFEMYMAKSTDADLTHLPAWPQLKTLDLNEDKQLTDAALASLKGLPALERLQLRQSQISDAGVPDLLALKKLVALNVVKTKLTADGVKRLHEGLPRCRIESDHGTFEPAGPRGPAASPAPAPQAAVAPVAVGPDLELAQWVFSLKGSVKAFGPNELTIPGMAFRNIAGHGSAATMPAGHRVLGMEFGGGALDDEALKRLGGLTQLRWVSLHQTLSGSQLAALGSLVNLQSFDLRQGTTTDADLAQIPAWPRLEDLHLVMLGSLTDACIPHLQRLPVLNRLAFYEVPITDACVPSLLALNRLIELQVKNTKLTAEGVRKLHEGLPNCHIESDHGTFGPPKPPIPGAPQMHPMPTPPPPTPKS